MTEDPMDEIKVKAKASFAAHDAKRKVLIAKYQNAKTTKAQFRALAKLMRLHADWMNGNMFTSGWVAGEVTQYARHVEMLADDL
jgi:hypothetical protein